jgi:hypothetical protein
VGTESDEVFDHELTRVLQEHGQMLEEQSRVLLAKGAASIELPGVVLQARLRAPSRYRKGLLEIRSEDSNGGELGTSSRPLDRAGRERGSLSLTEEIAVDLALEFLQWRASPGPQ